jgi:hypothetical protein
MAAYHAIMARRPDEALELLEFSRGVLWSQLSESDLDRDRLRELAPELAERLTQIDETLERIELTPGASQDRSLADRRIRLARQRAVLADQARDELGQRSAPRPAGAAELTAAARNGPVVLVNTSPERCDALIVSIDGLRTLPLPALDPGVIGDKINLFLDALTAANWSFHDPAAEKALADVLAWLWNTTVEPVLSALGHTGPPAPGVAYPRVWWCPTGPMSFLPLHAAGRHTADGRNSALDRVVSSYAPNLRSLIQAQRRPAEPESDPGRLLVVKTLNNDSPERWLPPHLTTVLSGADATPPRVAEALSGHTCIHLSAHGIQDVTDPSAGYIQLNGGALRLSYMRPGLFPRGRFAFLSACETATGGFDLSDEMITLTTAFQYAGFDHVIGTVWAVRDDAAIMVEERVYRELLGQNGLRPERAATALREATAQIRDRCPAQPSLWLPFIHAGK